jgi:hypothetical protein
MSAAGSRLCSSLTAHLLLAGAADAPVSIPSWTGPLGGSMGFAGVRGTRRFFAGWTADRSSFLQRSVQTSPEEHTETDRDPERDRGAYQQG